MPNKMKNTGKPFEKDTKRVFDVLSQNERLTKVEMDVQLEGKDGKRQIDVLIESKIAGISIRTIVESRDYNKPLDVTHVDGLHSKMQDVNAHKAVLVSRKGFSKTAVSKANRLGITLCTLNNPNDELRDVGLEVPILIRDVYSINCSIQMKVHLEAGTTYFRDAFRTINDQSLEDLLNKSILEGEILFDDSESIIDWEPNLEKPFYVRPTEDNSKLELESLVVKIESKIKYLFGYISELNDSIVFKNLSEEDSSLIFTWPDLESLRSQLSEFESKDKVPNIQNEIIVTGVSVPQLSFGDDFGTFEKC